MTRKQSNTVTLLSVTLNLIVAMATLALRAAAQDAATDDSAWTHMDTRTLSTLPPTFILRSTQFGAGENGTAGGMAKAGNKMMGRSISFEMLMSLAYDVEVSKVIAPADKPSGKFDLLMTGPDASKEKLQAEIERTLGFTASKDTRATDALVLKVAQAGAPGLRPGQGGSGGSGRVFASSSASGGSSTGVRSRQINLKNQPVANLVRNLQGYFDKPLIDRTGLTGTYDVNLEISTGNGASESDAISQALSTQLGLSLTPSSEPLEMLVVKAK